LPEQLKLNL